MVTGQGAQVASVQELVRWASTALARDSVTYHIGNLFADRARDLRVHELAETIGPLQETGWLIGRQVPFQLAAMQGFYYLAVRALRERDADMFAPRTVRDHLSVSDPIALDVMTRLWGLGLIEEAPGRGWQLSAQGVRMLT